MNSMSLCICCSVDLTIFVVINSSPMTDFYNQLGFSYLFPSVDILTGIFFFFFWLGKYPKAPGRCLQLYSSLVDMLNVDLEFFPLYLFTIIFLPILFPLFTFIDWERVVTISIYDVMCAGGLC